MRFTYLHFFDDDDDLDGVGLILFFFFLACGKREIKNERKKKCTQLYVYGNTRWFIIIIFIIIMHRGGVSLSLVCDVFFNASYNYRHSSVTELSQLMVFRALLSQKKKRQIYLHRSPP